MNISLNWLNTYLDQPIDTDEAERVLTSAGFPFDGLHIGATDSLLDIEITSNRPDCLSHLGIAREIAAATDRNLIPPAITPPANGGAPVADLTSVEIIDNEHCPAYTARVITGVKVAPSPDWLVERLEAVGLRAVNNIVDITNFVLHEMGQPLHTFDFNKLTDKKIVVRQAVDGEHFTAIDGTKHVLKAPILVIADANKPAALAGVMGGLDSEVTDATTDILLESARFEALSIRSTSRGLKLASDSSYRFERGVDQQGVERASQRAAQLICEIAGGTLATGVITAGQAPAAAHTATMRTQRCRDLMGVDIADDKMVAMLDQLELAPQLNGDSITCTIPSHRLDLYREADLIEEVARVFGYDNIHLHEKMEIITRPPQAKIEARKVVVSTLNTYGYHETVNFSFMAPALAQRFANSDDLVRVDEEKKKAEPALRPSILPSLLACRKSNQDAGNDDVKLFEIAQVFGAKNGAFNAARTNLGLITDANDTPLAMRQMRGALEETLLKLGLADSTSIVEAKDTPAWASAAAEIVGANNQTLGYYGPASADMLKAFDLQTPVILAELSYETIIATYPAIVQVTTLPKFPAIERDLSALVDESVKWDAIESLITEINPPLMTGVDFVTAYRGKQVGKGQKSLTFRMTFRDPERTLQHEEVTEQVDTIIARLTSDLKAEIRS